MKAAIYTRTATENPKAMGRQADRCQAFARGHGWEVIGTWTDVGSGLDADRPGLAALCRSVRAGVVEAVVATLPERIGRDAALMQAVVGEAGRADVTVVFVDEDPTQRAIRETVEEWHSEAGGQS